MNLTNDQIQASRRVLDPAKAGMMGDVGIDNVVISLTRQGSVRRRWSGLNASDIHLHRTFLDLYTDATNNSPSSFVVDPVVCDATGRSITVPGRWRQAFTIVRTRREDEHDLIQELRLGWIENLVTNGAPVWDEARVEDTTWYGGDGEGNTTENYVVVLWEGVSPTKAAGLVAALEGIDAAWSPVINGESIGAYRRLRVTSSEQGDGSASVKALLANSRLTFTSYEHYNTAQGRAVIYDSGVPTDMVPSVLELRKETGASSRISQPDERGLVHIITSTLDVTAEGMTEFLSSVNNRFSEYTTLYYGLTKAEAKAKTVTETAGETRAVRKRATRDGKWDVEVGRVVRSEQVRENDVVGLSAFEKTTLSQHLGTTTLPSVPHTTGNVVDEGYTVARAVEILEDARLNVRDRVGKAETGETGEHTVEKRHDGTLIKRRRAEHIPTADPPAWTLEPGSLTPGTGVSVERQLNEHKGFRVTRQEQVAAETQFPGGVDPHADATTSYKATHWNGDAWIKIFYNVVPANIAARLMHFESLSASHRISGTPEFNPITGTFNLLLTAVPRPWDALPPPRFRAYSETKNIKIIERTTINGRPYSRVLDAVHYMRGSVSEATAVNIGLDPNYGSHFSPQAGGQFFHYEARHVADLTVAYTPDPVGGA